MEKTEAQRLLGLEKRLQAKIIGQDYAGNVIAKALRRSRVDLKARNDLLVHLCSWDQQVWVKLI